jgi:hypothetical protein
MGLRRQSAAQPFPECEGFTGSLTMIDDELGEPYDRPPLSNPIYEYRLISLGSPGPPSIGRWRTGR